MKKNTTLAFVGLLALALTFGLTGCPEEKGGGDDNKPTVTSAAYDVGTGVLTITGTNFTVDGTSPVDGLELTKITLGGIPLTAATTVSTSTATAISITVAGTDKTAVDGSTGFDTNGVKTDALALADGWYTGADAVAAKDVTVSGYGIAITAAVGEVVRLTKVGTDAVKYLNAGATGIGDEPVALTTALNGSKEITGIASTEKWAVEVLPAATIKTSSGSGAITINSSTADDIVRITKFSDGSVVYSNAGGTGTVAYPVKMNDSVTAVTSGANNAKFLVEVFEDTGSAGVYSIVTNASTVSHTLTTTEGSALRSTVVTTAGTAYQYVAPGDTATALQATLVLQSATANTTYTGNSTDNYLTEKIPAAKFLEVVRSF
ncbi:hypothetical protein FACS1894164_11940 [Spirochaetia bacterium]|nr:hypothetical protein FACS1894164_11940 [Spirochaetia bacterium]